MEFIDYLKQRKLAILATSTSKQIKPQQKKVIDQSIQILTYGSLFGKLLIGGVILFGVNWKKQVPYIKRQFPLAFGAIGMSAFIDFGLSQYVWNNSEQIVKKYTGFRSGIFISPEKMENMKKMYENRLEGSKVSTQVQQDLMHDEQN